MMRMAFGVTVLAALLGIYWVSPSAAWVALFATSTLALARHIRQRDDEAERILNPIQE